MVVEFETDDGPAYQCEECGDTFRDEDAAVEHEGGCFVPPHM